MLDLSRLSSANVTKPSIPFRGDPGYTAMTDKFAPPDVIIRRYSASLVCDVIVVVRGQEMVLRCPNYSQALKWARLECKSYNIPEPVADIESDDQVPLFLLPGSK